MAGKKKGGKARPKTAVKRGKKDGLMDVDRPATSVSAEDQAAFARLKIEIYGMSLYQQIAPSHKMSYFTNVPIASMKVPIEPAAAKGGKKGKGKGKKKK